MISLADARREVFDAILFGSAASKNRKLNVFEQRIREDERRKYETEKAETENALLVWQGFGQ